MSKKLTKRTIESLAPQKTPYDARDSELKGFLVRVMPSGTMTYYFQYKNADGKQRNYRIGNTKSLTPAQARDTAEAISADVIKGIDIQAEKARTRVEGQKAKYKTLGGFIEGKYSEWAEKHLKTGAQTVKRIDTHFSQFYERPLTDINAWIIEKWRTERLKSGLSRGTVNKDITVLKAALSKAVEWELIDSNPLAKVTPLKTDDSGNIRYLSEDEEMRLRKALADRDTDIMTARDSANEWRRARGYEPLPSLSSVKYADHLSPMVLLALNTGMRRSELFNLGWENVNLSGRTLTIAGASAKSGKTRHIPLNQQAIQVLQDWQKQTGNNGLVFKNQKGQRFDNIQTSWEGLIKTIKIRNYRFHDLRHTFASKLVMKGVPLNTVRELLGHADLKTTLRYSHLAPDHKAYAVESLV